jgi:cytochrome c oxidase subunit 2
MESLSVAASTFAKDIDNLIAFIFVVVGFWFILAEGVLFYFIMKFRAKKGVRAEYITGEKKEHTKWISIPHALVLVCDVFILVGAIKVWMDVKQTLPPADETVRIVSQQWAWTFVHPGPDGKLDTADDIVTVDEMHAEVNKNYHFKLESKDVLHSFSVPAFRLKQDAVPGRVVTGWFNANRAGKYDIQCAEICGIAHGIMAARMVVETPQEHQAWLAAHAPVAAAPASPAPAQPHSEKAP